MLEIQFIPITYRHAKSHRLLACQIFLSLAGMPIPITCRHAKYSHHLLGYLLFPSLAGNLLPSLAGMPIMPITCWHVYIYSCRVMVTEDGLPHPKMIQFTFTWTPCLIFELYKTFSQPCDQTCLGALAIVNHFCSNS